MYATQSTYYAGTLSQKTLGDRFLGWLTWVLLGYALLSRGFAYVGYPPIFIGEVTLLFGGVALATSRALGTAFRLGAIKLLVLVMVWGLVCTLPHVGTYGVDALRDAVLWGYGVFAIITAGLLIEKPERLRFLLVRYRGFVWIFLGLIWLLFIVYKLYQKQIPVLYEGAAPIITAKGGDILVHLTGVTAFLLVGLARATTPVMLLLGFNLLLVMVSNRGGMLAFVVALFVFVALRPPRARIARWALAVCILIAALGLVNPTIKIHAGRTLSVVQMWENFASIFERSESSSLEGTESWRLAWWGKIVDYTVFGEHFWRGKGFGINLAESDGFHYFDDENLRSPHNGHLTMLARAGVPGFVLWLLLQATWLWAVLKSYWHSRGARDPAWPGIFLFLFTYWIAFMINATFDVYLEGPMGGIWFWSLFGVGLAAVWIYRHHPEVAYD